MSLRESRGSIAIAALLRCGVRFSTQATCVFGEDAVLEGSARQGGPSLHRASRVHANADSGRTLSPRTADALFAPLAYGAG